MKKANRIVGKILPVTGIILVIVSNILSAIQGTFTPVTTGGVVLGLLLFLSIFLRFESSNVRYYINVGLYTLFSFGIVVFIYMIASMYPKQWDLTKQNLFSLSEQSLKFLENLDKEVKLVAFTDDRQTAEQFLKRYSVASNKISHEIHNPFKDTLIAREYDTNVVPGDTFVISGDKKKKVSIFTESVFTNAIAEVIRAEQTVIYFLQGHGERTLQQDFSTQRQRGDPSLSELKRLLEERALMVKEVNITEKGYVPEDCSVLVCAGPTADLFPVEIDIIKNFLNKGGRAIFMLDPISLPMVRFEQFGNLLDEFGIIIREDIVVDLNPISQALYGDPLSPLVYSVGNHPVLEELEKNKAFFVPQTRTVSPKENITPELAVDILLQTSEYAWAEDLSKLLAEKKISQPDQDQLREQAVAVAVAKQLPPDEFVYKQREMSNEARMLVFGDSDMFANANISSASAVIFLNGVKWLTEQKDIVAIPEKVIESTPVILSAAQTQLIFIILVITLPSLIFFGGLSYTILRRRTR